MRRESLASQGFPCRTIDGEETEALPPLPGFGEPPGADGLRSRLLEVPGTHADHFRTGVRQAVRIVNRRRITLLLDRARLEQARPIEIAAADYAYKQRTRQR
jgi:hypothetical protein